MEVIPPIVAAILTTIIAFTTFFFLPGRLGAFFGEIATVVGIILAISLIEAFIILPAHLAHSRALDKEAKSFFINRWADSAITWLRDTLYLPLLRFNLEFKIFGFAVPIALFIITIGAMKGGVIRFSFFPPIASDSINISLKMPQGTNENITDSLITHIEKTVWEVNESFTERQTDNLQVIKNTIKRLGPGSSNGSVTVNLLPGERRDFQIIRNLQCDSRKSRTDLRS